MYSFTRSLPRCIIINYEEIAATGLLFPYLKYNIIVSLHVHHDVTLDTLQTVFPNRIQAAAAKQTIINW